MPCGCIVTGDFSLLRKWTIIVSPTLTSSSGPGTFAGPSGFLKCGVQAR